MKQNLKVPTIPKLVYTDSPVNMNITGVCKAFTYAWLSEHVRASLNFSNGDAQQLQNLMVVERDRLIYSDWYEKTDWETSWKLPTELAKRLLINAQIIENPTKHNYKTFLAKIENTLLLQEPPIGLVLSTWTENSAHAVGLYWDVSKNGTSAFFDPNEGVARTQDNNPAPLWDWLSKVYAPSEWSDIIEGAIVVLRQQKIQVDSVNDDTKYSIVLSGETYSLLEIPPESSKAVLAGKKAILENLRLDNLVTGLNRASGLVYVAQNGVAGFGSLMAAMTGLSDSIIKAASDASLTLSGFADESKTILSHLKRSMTFLLKGHEDLAVKFLTKCASSAQEMSTQSSKLADRFDKLGDQAIEVLKNTQVEQGRQHEKIEQQRIALAKLQADTAEAKTLSEQLATQRVELKTMYEDAKAKEDKAAERAFALQIVGAIFGAIGSGLNSFAGGMKPGNSAPPPAKSPAAKPTPPATGKATTPPEKSGDAKGSDAKKSDSEKETEAAAHGSADASNSISDSTDKIASSQEDAAQSYRSEKMKYLDKLLEAEEKQRKALADIAKYAELLKSTAQEKQIAETTAAALHQAVGALKSIASTLRDNSFFWQLMAQACQKLAAPEFLEVIKEMKDLSLEERLEIYLEDDFKIELITYYAQWQALNLVCNEYSAAVFEARAQMLADFQKNPTIEEAQKQAPVLAAQLLADTEADLKKLDERRAAIDVEKKVLSGAGAATA